MINHGSLPFATLWLACASCIVLFTGMDVGESRQGGAPLMHSLSSARWVGRIRGGMNHVWQPPSDGERKQDHRGNDQHLLSWTAQNSR